MVRFKNRYITVEINDEEQAKKLNLQQAALHYAIQNKVKELFGDLGQATIKAGFNAKYCNPRTKLAVVKVRHGPHEMVLKAFPQIDKIGGNAVRIKILYTGATLKHCFLFIKRHQSRQVEAAFANMNNDQERKQLIETLMTLTNDMENFK